MFPLLILNKFFRALGVGAAVSILLDPWGFAAQITLRIPFDPLTLDWNRAVNPIEREIIQNLMVGFFEWNISGSSPRIESVLASDYRSLDNGKTYMIRLRPNVQWSDGRPLRIQDFVDSWERVLQPTTASPFAQYLFDVKGAQEFHEGKVKVFSDVGFSIKENALYVELKRPNAQWVRNLAHPAFFPIRKDLIEKGSEWTRPGNLVTLGPYLLSVYDVGSKLSLKKNNHYFGKISNIDSAEILIVPKNSEAIELFRKGKLDLAFYMMPPFGKSVPQFATYYLGMNTRVFPWNQLEVRKALAQGLNPDQIQKALKPLNWVRSEMAFNAEEAKRTFKKASTLKLESYEPKLIHLPLEKDTLLAQAIKDTLKENLGFQVNLIALPYSVFFQTLHLGQEGLFIASSNIGYPDNLGFLSLFTSKSTLNWIGFSYPTYDRWIEEVQVIKEPSIRDQLIKKSQVFLQKEQTGIFPLISDEDFVMISTRLKNLKPNAAELCNLKDIYVQ